MCHIGLYSLSFQVITSLGGVWESEQKAKKKPIRLQTGIQKVRSQKIIEILATRILKKCSHLFPSPKKAPFFFDLAPIHLTPAATLEWKTEPASPAGDEGPPVDGWAGGKAQGGLLDHLLRTVTSVYSNHGSLNVLRSTFLVAAGLDWVHRFLPAPLQRASNPTLASPWDEQRMGSDKVSQDWGGG